jgi:hypothetical protein
MEARADVDGVLNADVRGVILSFLTDEDHETRVAWQRTCRAFYRDRPGFLVLDWVTETERLLVAAIAPLHPFAVFQVYVSNMQPLYDGFCENAMFTNGRAIPLRNLSHDRCICSSVFGIVDNETPSDAPNSHMVFLEDRAPQVETTTRHLHAYAQRRAAQRRAFLEQPDMRPLKRALETAERKEKEFAAARERMYTKAGYKTREINKHVH